MSRGIQSVLVGGQGQKTNAYSHGEQLRGKMLDTQPHTSKLCQRNRWAKKVNGYLKSRTRYMFLIYKYIYIYIYIYVWGLSQRSKKAGRFPKWRPQGKPMTCFRPIFTFNHVQPLRKRCLQSWAPCQALKVPVPRVATVESSTIGH